MSLRWSDDELSEPCEYQPDGSPIKGVIVGLVLEGAILVVLLLIGFAAWLVLW